MSDIPITMKDYLEWWDQIELPTSRDDEDFRLISETDVSIHGDFIKAVRIEAASVDHVPGARDDALLVGAEERERPAVGDADDPEDRSATKAPGIQISELLPPVLPYLALPPGWRFVLAENHQDVWYDPELLQV